MRKKFIYICSVICSIAMMFSSVAVAETNTQKIKVVLDGKTVEFENQEPAIVQSRTLIPLRGLFEQMGYSVEWEPTTKSCTITNGVQVISMRAGEKGMQVDGELYMLEVPAQIINNSFMIPLRAVAECTGASVLWDAFTKTITIDSIDGIQNSYDTNEYIREYFDILDELGNANILFKTLNSLTDKNYSKNYETLVKEAETAKSVLQNVQLELTELVPPDEYAEVHKLSLEAIDVSLELCDLVDKMLDGSLTYDESSEEINTLLAKANEINKKLDSTTASLNSSLYR